MSNKCAYNPNKTHKKHRNNIIKKSMKKNNIKKSAVKKSINKNNVRKSINKKSINKNNKKKVIKLENKDYLIKFGYSTKLSKKDRHKILLIAVSKYGYSNVIHRLVALRTLTKNTQPKKSKKYNNDIIELQKWKKYMEHIMKGGSNTRKNINKIIKNILNIEKKLKNNKK